MVLLDLADESWFPLVMILVIGVVLYLLFRSMRHEIGKIRVPGRPQPHADVPPQSPDDADDR
ncbi:MAG TPA: hypothetical protein VM429_07265 [Micropruina sp.]|nr:hypothetical protein [Micropruina sp.]